MSNGSRFTYPTLDVVLVLAGKPCTNIEIARESIRNHGGSSWRDQSVGGLLESLSAISHRHVPKSEAVNR